jgi:hypothetical protein
MGARRVGLVQRAAHLLLLLLRQVVQDVPRLVHLAALDEGEVPEDVLHRPVQPFAAVDGDEDASDWGWKRSFENACFRSSRSRECAGSGKHD